MRNKFLKLSKWSFIGSLIVFTITFIIFHYVTDAGFTTVFQAEPGKPFVTNWFGNLGTLFLFASIFCLMIANVFYKE